MLGCVELGGGGRGLAKLYLVDRTALDWRLLLDLLDWERWEWE